MTDLATANAPARPADDVRSGVLRRLVTDVDALRAAWEREPLHSTGLGDFDDVFGLALADDLITGRGLRIPYLRMLHDGTYLRASRFTHRTGTAAGSADGVADPNAVLREIRAGATVVLRGLVRYCPPLADFCAALSGELGLATSAGAYLTPAGSRGAGPHYDPMSVLVRQLHGVKHWRLQEPPQRWPRQLPAPGERYDTPVIAELSLRPGESLYVPRGVVHDCWTTDEMSVHVTFSGDTPVTWADVLHDVLDQITDADPDLRAALPWRFADDPAALTDVAGSVLDHLRAALAAVDPADVADRVLDRHTHVPDTPPRGQLGHALLAAR
jgi:hypothetical protein